MKVKKFSSQYCGPCKIYSPTFKNVVSDFKQFYKNVEVEEIDIDDQPDLAADYNIMSIPTTIIESDDGTILFMKQGIVQPNDLKLQLELAQAKENE